MARVVLVMPELPQRLGAPYLGQLYLAAALRRAGHEVNALDLGARYGSANEDTLCRALEATRPDAVGVTLFTYNALKGYAIAERLQGKGPLLIAGGPHVTVRPKEALSHGFDLAIAGEGEYSLLKALRALEEQKDFREVEGAHFQGGEGPPVSPISDLGALAQPHEAVSAFDLSAYWPEECDHHALPGGMMTSRGCPARCTFCANYVTGRLFRYRPAEEVVEEMVALHTKHGIQTFPFWDDAFTANRRRLRTLCEAIIERPELRGTTWTCITPANMVKPVDLELMARAGCTTINFGIESADRTILRSIRKGQAPEQVYDAVRAANALKMTTVVNFMFGFPNEGVDALHETMRLMERLAPHTDYFNSRGVLVPFPGTPLYEEHHTHYGFTDWWLDPERIPAELHERDPVSALTELEHDPALDINYFNYSDEVRDMIRACVLYKARHNQARIRRYTEPHLAHWPLQSKSRTQHRSPSA